MVNECEDDDIYAVWCGPHAFKTGLSIAYFSSLLRQKNADKKRPQESDKQAWRGMQAGCAAKIIHYQPKYKCDNEQKAA